MRHRAERRQAVALLVSIGLVVVSCGHQQGPEAVGPSALASLAVERSAPDSPDTKGLVAGINALGYRLFQATVASTDEDVVLSPLSIGLAFGMVDVGASGPTADALDELFGFQVEGEPRWAAFNTLEQSVTDVEGPVLRVANRLFPDEQLVLVEGYDERLARWFGATSDPLPLRADPEASRQSINRWVSERTEELIPELIGVLSPDSALVLVNALYLKADWTQPFLDDFTHDAPFFPLDSTPASVPMMHTSGLETSALVTDRYAAVELVYAGDELSMLLIVPDEGYYAEVEGQLDSGLLDAIERDARPGSVELFLPRFETDTATDLRQLLEDDLGVVDLFDVEGFTGIGPEVTLAAALHAAKIAVDEHGTVAAAATALELAGSEEPDGPTLTIRADRPFLYLIRHRASGAVLFVGRVLNPAA
jgi:serpin B